MIKDFEIRPQRDTLKHGYVILSDKQINALQLTWDGYTANETGKILGVARKTINDRIIYAKKRTGYSRTFLLIRHCIRDGVITWVPTTKPLIELTKDQIDSLQGLYDGLTIEETGLRLFRSYGTINGRIRTAKTKTQIKRTALLLRYALDKGLIK